MGTVNLSATEDDILGTIRSFSQEEELGKVYVERRGAFLVARAPGSRSWSGFRCTWSCTSRGRRTSVKIRPKPPRWKVLQLYACMSLQALSLVAVGLPLLVWGLRAVLVVFPALCLGLVSAGLFWYTRWNRSARAAYGIESRFVQHLASRYDLIDWSPSSNLLPFWVHLYWLIIPGIFFVAGTVRVFPVLAIPVSLGIAALMVRSLLTKDTQNVPQVAWRLLLTDWLDATMIMRHPGLLAVGLFAIPVASTIVLHSSNEVIDPENFLRATQWHLPLDLQGELPQNVLVASGTLLRGAMDRPVVKEIGPQFLWFLQGMRVVIWGAVFLIFAGGITSMSHWLRTWGLARRTPSLALPSPGKAVPLTRHALPALGIGARLVLGGLVNVLHLGLAAEVLSVLLTGRAVVVPPAARSIAWMLMDIDAAARGVDRVNPIGVVLVAVLILPTALTIVAWSSFVIRNMLGGLWHRASAPVSSKLTAVVTEQALALGIQRPVVRLTRGGAPRLETRVPWLFGRSTILVTRSAVESLSEPELKAALAHEVAHVKNDATALRFTRWLSFLSFFPCNVFAVLLDGPSRERRADETAARLTGSTDAIAASLVKVSLGIDLVVPRPEGRAEKSSNEQRKGTLWGHLAAYLHLLGGLLQPDLLLGYAHPRAQDRILALCNGAGTSGTDAPQECE